MSWAQFSAIFEHLNYQRRLLGFYVFGGFPVAGENDMTGESLKMYEEGKMSLDSFGDITRSIEIFDKNRFISSIPKVLLVKGDVKETAPDFIEKNPETIVSLLYLDVNLYNPTKAA
jgi:hypothetical protein